MEWLKFLNFSLIFLAGFLSCLLIGFIYSGTEMPFGLAQAGTSEAPGDWVKESQIHVYDNAVVIDVEKASISKYAATGSMIPVLDEKSNGIRIIPKDEKQVRIGDIVTFEKDGELIVHRVIEIGEDSEGNYFVTKGDNNAVDDGKIRFKDIKYVTIGVLW